MSRLTAGTMCLRLKPFRWQPMFIAVNHAFTASCNAHYPCDTMPQYLIEQCLPQFVHDVSTSNHFDTIFVLMEWRSASHPSLHCDLAFRSLKFDVFFQFETIWYNLMWTFFEDSMLQCRIQGWGKLDIRPGLPGHKTSEVDGFIDFGQRQMLQMLQLHTASLLHVFAKCVEYVWVCHEHIARCLHGMHTMLARLSIQITHWAWQNVTTVTTCDMHYIVAMCMLQFFPLSSFRCPACALSWASEMFLRFCFRNNSANGCYEVSYLVAGHRL